MRTQLQQAHDAAQTPEQQAHRAAQRALNAQRAAEADYYRAVGSPAQYTAEQRAALKAAADERTAEYERAREQHSRLVWGRIRG